MKKNILGLFFLVLIILVAFFIGKINGDPNKKLTYGETGLPRNCRATIAANIEGVNSGLFKPEEALSSIDRNCGRYGYSWGIK